MNIVFLSTLNPYDINSWSGTTWHILKSLKKNNNITVIGTHMLSQASYFKSNNFLKNNARNDYSLLFGNVCTDLINKVANCDIVFFGDLNLSPYLDIDIPTVHLSDVNYHLFKDYLDNKRSDEQVKQTEGLEKKLLKEYDSIIYSSEWIKKNTTDYYNIDSRKIHVVEFGANIPTPLNYKINIQTDVCNLLFIGRNWKKKGGEKALGAYKTLKSRGVKCTLTIIGSVPQMADKEDEDIVVIPFLDKSKPEHLEMFCSILRSSHFLVLPTEFDAFGIVFCEASAYGVPSIAGNVGGVSQPVREGKNGYLLDANATAQDYADKIKSVFSNKNSYLELRKSSRHEFETRLNWDVWGEKVNNILEETVLKHKKKYDK